MVCKKYARSREALPLGKRSKLSWVIISAAGRWDV